MTKKFLLLQSVALAAMTAVGGAAHAAFTVYDNQATFLGMISSPGVDTYTGLSITASTSSPLIRSAGSYSYTATVLSPTSANPLFFGAGTAADPWLSTNTATDSISFSGFSGGVSAIGGNFFDSNIAGAFAAGSITLTATDSFGATLTQTITGATTSSFLGFVSTGTITSLVVTSVQPDSPTALSLWPTVDNLTLGVTAVPEPETYALLLAGLALVGAAARRRRG